ncbi:MAG: hypothetical protein ACFN02_09155, partial [Olsenella profusa]
TESPITKSGNGDCLRKKISGNTQSGGEQGFQFQAIQELNREKSGSGLNRYESFGISITI